MSECQNLLLFTLQIKAISRLAQGPGQVLLHTCFQSCGSSDGLWCGCAAGAVFSPVGPYETKSLIEGISVSLCVKLGYTHISGK